jgi:GSH-dependent disulfide-bond oxidoreductase
VPHWRLAADAPAARGAPRHPKEDSDMLKFYYNAAPNPMKVALLLEELGLPYEPVPVDTRKGEQHTDAFKALNPNAKVPVVDDEGAVVFDSNAILLYLADKHGRFVPTDLKSPARGQMLAWLMFVASGIGPYSGQSVHFRHAAPEPKEYALNRYDFEAHRHWRIVDDRLAKSRFMAGGEYGIVDMAFWGWARLVPYVLGLADPWQTYPNVKRLLDEINARPAVARVEALRTRHAFKTENDAEAQRHMFPQNERLKRSA